MAMAVTVMDTAEAVVVMGGAHDQVVEEEGVERVVVLGHRR